MPNLTFPPNIQLGTSGFTAASLLNIISGAAPEIYIWVEGNKKRHCITVLRAEHYQEKLLSFVLPWKSLQLCCFKSTLSIQIGSRLQSRLPEYVDPRNKSGSSVILLLLNVMAGINHSYSIWI